MEPWLAEVISRPLDESELTEFRSSSDPNQDPELALHMDQDAVPVWWPVRHPRTGEPMSHEQRREFFLEWLGSVWNVRDQKIRLGSQAYRRRRLGIELVCVHAEMPEAWEQMPWDERL